MNQQEARGLHGYVLVWLAALAVLLISIFIIAALVMQEDGWGEERLTLNAVQAQASPPTPQTVLPRTPPPTPQPLIAGRGTLVPSRMPAATLVPVQDRAFDLGVQVMPDLATNDGSLINDYLQNVADDLHLNWVRLEIRWEELEPEFGARQWDSYDQFFRAAVQHNLRVLVTVSGVPLWMRAPGANPLTQSPPLEPGAFAEFVGDLLRRYPNQIHAIEVWEGINTRQRWDAPLDAASYIELLGEVAKVVRSLDSNIILISGGLTPLTVSDGQQSVDSFTYMDMLIDGGLLNIVDCVGAQHSGYNVPPAMTWDELTLERGSMFQAPLENPQPAWSFASTLSAYANKIILAGYTTPLCVTQFGWASAEDLPSFTSNLTFAYDNSLQEQANWTVEAVNRLGGWDFIWLAFLWNLNAGPDSAFDPSDDAIAYSLMRPDGVLSPAWRNIAEMDFRQRPR